MSTTTKRWNAAKEGKILAALFESNKADPRFAKAADIDPFKDTHDDFKDFTLQQFRNNCKTAATNWMAGKAVEGTRLQSLNLDNKEQPEQLPEEENVFDDTLESNDKKTVSANDKNSPPARPTRSNAACKHKDDEREWKPIFQSSRLTSAGHHREELIIEPPAGFDGSEGTCQASFDDDNSVFVLKVPPNPILTDPHDINSHCQQEHGIATAKDSARSQAFKASAKENVERWCTCRHHLAWKGKPSDDIGRWWLDFTEMEKNGRVCPVLIVNPSSIKPVETVVQKMSGKLRKKTFKSPEKKDAKQDSNASELAVLSKLFPSLDDALEKQAAATHGVTPEEVESFMDVERENERKIGETA